ILGVILGVLLDGGRIISTGEVSEGLLCMVPDVLYFEKREPDDLAFFSQLSSRDLLFVEKRSVDQLWVLSKMTGAQLATISERNLDSTLVDYQIQEKDLRSALLGLKGWLRKVQDLKENFHLEGARVHPGLFLDRDGVVIEDVDYIHRVEDCRLASGIVDL